MSIAEMNGGQFMPVVTEERQIGDSRVRLSWVKTCSYEGCNNITQAYGFCFDREDRILLIRAPGRDWSLPGGRPEHGEKPEEALIREVDEEASVVIDEPQLVGYQEVRYPHNPNKTEGDLFCQLRFTACVVKIKPIRVDPDTGILHERCWVEIADLPKFLRWGVTGRALIADLKASWDMADPAAE